MRSFCLLPVALLPLLTSAYPGVEARSPQITDPAELSAAVNAAVSEYIPQSILPAVGVAIQSAAAAVSITGNINSIVASALAASTPPPYLTAVPSEYQSDIHGLQSALSSLRATPSTTATLSSITSGPLIIMTATHTNGSLYNMTRTPDVSQIVVYMINSYGSDYNVTVTESIRNVTSTTSMSSTALLTTIPTTGGIRVTTVPSGGASGSGPGAAASSTQSGFAAAATQVPFAAAAGFLGCVGMLLATL